MKISWKSFKALTFKVIAWIVVHFPYEQFDIRKDKLFVNTNK